ncbi:hypothetical protein Purlil1_14399 [Purpureocillium lilacinum]|uniref:Uncharacterized protein n=1 Tax=Purpureocillium lilacinum TaxID=33203 RepID=A0ABR0BBI2_PURLI|nr:hypothetical protein Purlil1_14399 [Purpureocillium lilacinum]
MSHECFSRENVSAARLVCPATPPVPSARRTPPPRFNGLLCRAFGMASSPTLATDALEYFKEFGIFYLEDAVIGRAVQQIDDLGLSTSLESWDNLKHIIVGNPQVHRILAPFLDQRNPRRCHTFGPEPGRVFCFWPQPNQSHRLVVSVWSAGTKLELYYGSHKDLSKAAPASNGLFEVPRRGPGEVVQLETGGIALLDVRFLIQRIAGFTIAYGMDIDFPPSTGSGHVARQTP